MVDVSQEFRKLNGLFHGAARMGAHEVGYQILVHAAFPVHPLILLHELQVDAVARFSKHVKDPVRDMLRRHLQLSGNMVFHQFPQESVIRIGSDVIKTHAGTDKYFFDARKIPQLFKKLRIAFMAYCQVRAGLRKEALPVLTHALCQLLFTGGLMKVRGRPADVMNISLESGILRKQLRFLKDRFVAAGLYDSPLMKGQGTEITSAVTAPVTDKAEFNFLDSRNSACLFVHWMIRSLIGKVIYFIHFLTYIVKSIEI